MVIGVDGHQTVLLCTLQHVRIVLSHVTEGKAFRHSSGSDPALSQRFDNAINTKSVTGGQTCNQHTAAWCRELPSATQDPMAVQIPDMNVDSATAADILKGKKSGRSDQAHNRKENRVHVQRFAIPLCIGCGRLSPGSRLCLSCANVHTTFPSFRSLPTRRTDCVREARSCFVATFPGGVGCEHCTPDTVSQETLWSMCGTRPTLGWKLRKCIVIKSKLRRYRIRYLS